MIEFFIVFIIVGYIIGITIADSEKSIIIILLISILWMFAFGFWAIATFIELLLGYTLAKRLV